MATASQLGQRVPAAADPMHAWCHACHFHLPGPCLLQGHTLVIDNGLVAGVAGVCVGARVVSGKTPIRCRGSWLCRSRGWRTCHRANLRHRAVNVQDTFLAWRPVTQPESGADVAGSAW
jgi:hypothetical protein